MLEEALHVSVRLRACARERGWNRPREAAQVVRHQLVASAGKATDPSMGRPEEARRAVHHPARTSELAEPNASPSVWRGRFRWCRRARRARESTGGTAALRGSSFTEAVFGRVRSANRRTLLRQWARTPLLPRRALEGLRLAPSPPPLSPYCTSLSRNQLARSATCPSPPSSTSSTNCLPSATSTAGSSSGASPPRSTGLS